MTEPATNRLLEDRTIDSAQADMRCAYYGGATGLAVSATAWLAAAIVAVQGAPLTAVLTLYGAGVLIHPVGVLFDKILGRSGDHAKNNPLGPLALESLFVMLFFMPVAYVVFQYQTNWFFPTMLIIIGARYLVFATLFGLRAYWVCGVVLAGAGYVLAINNAPFWVGAWVGSGIEYLFAVIIFLQTRKELVDKS
ncbi:MAG: hypothetical protein DHS20C11_22120 [Lysobacteraceae bacterium]|nr:MAG: hypothetical protein DHS20C11_22120 [Xanthomonadaceae bacterium]